MIERTSGIEEALLTDEHKWSLQIGYEQMKRKHDILFSDEKMFDIDEFYNSHYER